MRHVSNPGYARAAVARRQRGDATCRDAVGLGQRSERVLPTRTARSTRRGPIRPRRRDGARVADAGRCVATAGATGAVDQRLFRVLSAVLNVLN